MQVSTVEISGVQGSLRNGLGALANIATDDASDVANAICLGFDLAAKWDFVVITLTDGDNFHTFRLAQGKATGDEFTGSRSALRAASSKAAAEERKARKNVRAELLRAGKCVRCGGQGRILGYKHVDGGICFECEGTGLAA